MSVEIALASPATAGAPAADAWSPDLRYAASFLRARGIDASCLCGVAPAAAAERVACARPALLYLRAGEDELSAGAEIAKAVRRACPDVPIALGGSAAAALPGGLVGRPEVDYLVRGDCELPLAEAALRLRRGMPLDGTPGMASRRADGGPPQLLPDLDALPPMATDGLAAALAACPPDLRVGHVTTSRGCRGRCSFCAVPLRSRWPGAPPWRGRSAARVVDELEALSGALGVRRFALTDDNFMGPGRAGRERAEALAAAILARGLDLELYLACRIDDVSEPPLSALARAGLRKLAVSVESTSQRSLDLFEKRFAAARIAPALGLLERLGIRTEVNLVFFEPYASLDDVRANAAFLARLARSRHLSYGRAFALGELRAPPWAPITARLEADGLLEPGGFACRYRDPRVQRLVEAVREMRDHPALDFKDPLLFPALREREAELRASGALPGALRLSAACRNLLNLHLLPELVTSACAALERDPTAAGAELRRAVATYEAEVRRLEGLALALATSHGARRFP